MSSSRWEPGSQVRIGTTFGTLAVARTGTLSAAATLLGTEHTTVARHIQALEDELKSRLFHNSNSGYGLTDAGERRLGAARAGAHRPASPARNRDFTQCQAVQPIETRGGYRNQPFASGAHARRVQAPHRSPAVCLRLTGVPERGGADPYKGGSPRAPLHRLCEELLFAPQLNYPDLIGADVEPRIRSTNVLTQLHATLSGSGLCMLPAFVASGYSTLAPVLPEQVSLTRSLHMQIHEDHRKAAHIREVAAFIVAEVERNHSLFHAPTAPAVASRWDILRNQRL